MFSRPIVLLLPVLLPFSSATALPAPPSRSTPLTHPLVTCTGPPLPPAWDYSFGATESCSEVYTAFTDSFPSYTSPIHWQPISPNDPLTVTPNALLGQAVLPQLAGGPQCQIKFDFASHGGPSSSTTETTLVAAPKDLARAADMIVMYCLLHGLGTGGVYDPTGIDPQNPGKGTNYPVIGVRVVMHFSPPS